jgi:hypothetical protein
MYIRVTSSFLKQHTQTVGGGDFPKDNRIFQSTIEYASRLKYSYQKFSTARPSNIFKEVIFLMKYFFWQP